MDHDDFVVCGTADVPGVIRYSNFTGEWADMSLRGGGREVPVFECHLP